MPRAYCGSRVRKRRSCTSNGSAQCWITQGRLLGRGATPRNKQSNAGVVVVVVVVVEVVEEEEEGGNKRQGEKKYLRDFVLWVKVESAACM